MFSSDVLVNPRQNISDYTKYSFPSKIIDYLSCGKPVVAYLLDGMPEIYKSFIFSVSDNSIDSLKSVLESILFFDNQNNNQKNKLALSYFHSNLTCKAVVNRMSKLN